MMFEPLFHDRIDQRRNRIVETDTQRISAQIRLRVESCSRSDQHTVAPVCGLIKFCESDAPGFQRKVVGDAFPVASVHTHVQPQLRFLEIPAERFRSRAAVPDHTCIVAFLIGNQIDKKRNPASGEQFQDRHRDRAGNIALAACRISVVAEHAEHRTGGDSKEIGKFRPAADRELGQTVFLRHRLESTEHPRRFLKFRVRDRTDTCRGVPYNAAGFFQLTVRKFPGGINHLRNIADIHGYAELAAEFHFIKIGGVESRNPPPDQSDAQGTQLPEAAHHAQRLFQCLRSLFRESFHKNIPLFQAVHDKSAEIRAAERVLFPHFAFPRFFRIRQKNYGNSPDACSDRRNQRPDGKRDEVHHKNIYICASQFRTSLFRLILRRDQFPRMMQFRMFQQRKVLHRILHQCVDFRSAPARF